MTKVKIGDKEYELGSLTALDLKRINDIKEKGKMSDYDQTFNTYLYAIKKFNPEVKMTIENFMDSFPLKDMQKKIKELNEIIGINFTQDGKK